MDLPVKTEREVDLLREAGRVARLALDAACAAVRAGVTTAELDAIAETVIRTHGATPEFKGYQGYPATTCISVNDEVVHGIPGPRMLFEGDLVSIDVGARLDGYVGDNARTVIVGEGDETTRHLVDTAQQFCLVSEDGKIWEEAVFTMAKSNASSSRALNSDIRLHCNPNENTNLDRFALMYRIMPVEKKHRDRILELE